MAVLQPPGRRPSRDALWRVVDYGLSAIVVAFLFVVLLLLLLGVTHGWSPN